MDGHRVDGLFYVWLPEEPAECGIRVNADVHPAQICNFARMKFEVGDKVVIQHSNDEGEVVEIINDKMVLVDVRA